MSISKSDYLQNLLSLNQFKKLENRKNFQQDPGRSRWIFPVFISTIWYIRGWNELLLPAGMLQFPLYEWTLPHYYNFGSMGTFVGEHFIRAIDRYGSFFLANGSYTSSWYSKVTVNNSKTVKQCYVDSFSNKTMGPYPGEGEVEPQTVAVKPKYSGRLGLAETSAIRLAYRAYKQWIEDKGEEKTSPIKQYTNDQKFFLAFAQTRCYSRTATRSYKYAKAGRIDANIRTNTELSLLNEFTEAFNCPAGSKMNSKIKCDTF